MNVNFIAIDFETANESRASVCQVGLVCYVDGQPQWEWSSLVNPEADFGPVQIGVHGITYADVRTAPTWPTAFEAIAPSLVGQVLVSHTAFDRDALFGACDRYGLVVEPGAWVDTCAVARQVWPDLPDHKLKTVCSVLGIETIKHHDASSDARGCGEIMRHALAASGCSLAEWQERASISLQVVDRNTIKRSAPKYSEDAVLEGDPRGPLFGHIVVATGEFSNGKNSFAGFAANCGCHVQARITRNTTILVLGRRDASQFNGIEKSGKHREVEALIAQGRQISILTEDEFMAWANSFRLA